MEKTPGRIASALHALGRASVAYSTPRRSSKPGREAPVTIPSERWIRYHVKGAAGETFARVDIPSDAPSYVHELAQELTDELLRRHPDASVVWLD
jgi:hypothetical protein